jgi:hypothetical protein
MIIFGINNDNLRESMLREINLSIEKTIQMARATERAKLQSRAMIISQEQDIDKIEPKQI